MSALSSTARVSILLADHARIEGQKIYVLGGGWQITALTPETGQTAPFTFGVLVDTAPDHYGDEFAFEAELRDVATGEVVTTPGADGSASPLRIGQNIVASAPVFVGVYVPPGQVWSRSQFAINFPGGLPLRAGGTYAWRVRLDNDDEHVWEASFHVVGPPPPTVFG